VTASLAGTTLRSSTTAAVGVPGTDDATGRCADSPAVQAAVRELAAARGTPREDDAREQLVKAALPLARSVARRFVNRGETFDDLFQAGCLGLVKAARGFDPDRGHDFVSYALPSIAGEVKRHFRDHGWQIRPPRRLQELRVEVRKVSDRLIQDLGRSPRMSEIAAAVGVDVEEIAECLASADGYHVKSLDAPAASADGDLTMADTIGHLEPQYALIEDVVSLREALAALPPRERRILALRYFQDRTQQQIADDIGVTQMQVSRLLARIHEQLRQALQPAEAS
jgi:RNA polymerase sigma-B factor